MPSFRLPNETQRISIIGRTGTGKTVFGCFVLARHSIGRMPWLVIDYKGEPIFEAVDRRAITEIKPGQAPGKAPGLYWMNPRPEIDDRAVEASIWKVWERGRTGIFIDEGHIAPTRSAAFETCMTQGRALHIPMITCSQQPIDVSTYVFTQADFIVAFPIQRREHQLIVESYIRSRKAMVDLDQLPEHWSLWCDVSRNITVPLRPCPPPDEVIRELNSKAPHRFWW